MISEITVLFCAVDLNDESWMVCLIYTKHFIHVYFYRLNRAILYTKNLIFFLYSAPPRKRDYYDDDGRYVKIKIIIIH